MVHNHYQTATKYRLWPGNNILHYVLWSLALWRYSTSKMETTGYDETLSNTRLHDVTSRKTIIHIFTAVKNSILNRRRVHDLNLTALVACNCHLGYSHDRHDDAELLTTGLVLVNLKRNDENYARNFVVFPNIVWFHGNRTGFRRQTTVFLTKRKTFLRRQQINLQISFLPSMESECSLLHWQPPTGAHRKPAESRPHHPSWSDRNVITLSGVTHYEAPHYAILSNP
jgi:hypothetical protein